MAFMVNVKPTGVEVAFEVGSLAEAVGVLQGEENALTTLMGITFAVRGEAEAAGPEAAKRGRKPKVETAVAPPPAPIPAAPADGSIPAFLDRNKGAGSAPPAPPPLVAAPPPPTAPVAPGGVIAEKFIAECTKRASTAPDKGAALVDWIAAHGLVIKGATFDETMACVRLLPDDKIKPAAAQLGIS